MTWKMWSVHQVAIWPHLWLGGGFTLYIYATYLVLYTYRISYVNGFEEVV